MSLQLTFINKHLTLVHGTLEEPGAFHYLIDEHAARATFAVLSTKICFVGHSHLAGIFVKDNRGRISYLKERSAGIVEPESYIVNVGSVGQPRDGDPDAAYCVYDTEARTIEIKRVAYDRETARRKIIDAGLPRFLGDRLLSGR
jgi:diadenosine tetraphosphatase ApaH/serine/threonine PP2A family protein phosphatase